MLQCSYSTNKFCSYFRKQEQCRRKECPFVHYHPFKQDYVLEDEFSNDKFFKMQKQYAYNYLESNPGQFYDFLRVAVKPETSKLPGIEIILKKTSLKKAPSNLNQTEE